LRHETGLIDYIDRLRESLKTVKQQHINYIHYNPVQHGFVKKAID
jgi:hypothetical protein